MSFQTGRVTIGTSGVALISSDTSERADIGVQIYADSANTEAIYLGNSTAVTADSSDTTDGYPLQAGAEMLITNRDPNEIFAICASGVQKVWFIIV